jgi:glycosyltransferase involved in cell wall biosynthesis
LDTEHLVEAYHASDIFAIMSTAETQSLVAMQAMACGMPVIAARAWGLAEYVGDDRGMLIAPGDLEGLTDALLRLAENSALRAELGRTGQKFVQQFSTEKIASLWESIYENAALSAGSHA